MEYIGFNYHSARSAKSRCGTAIRSVHRWLIIVTMLFALVGLTLLVVGYALGWLVIGIACVPFMLYEWYKYELHHLPSGPGQNIDDILSGDILGQLPEHPTPLDIAQAVGAVSSGLFFAVRFGLTPNLLRDVASLNNDIDSLWKTALSIREQTKLEHISGSILTVALIKQFPNYEQLLAQIHPDESDLHAGIFWHRHLRELIDQGKRPRRTGGIARDWAFGYIPLLTRFGHNISLGGIGSALTVEIDAHKRALDQLIDTFGTGGRQNAVLVGKAGSGKTTLIYALADRLLDGTAELPEMLRYRQVFILDSASLLAAAPGRGELEQLIMSVLGEAYAAKNIILCLDNAQLFFEEGIGSVDLTNVLQPILDAGKLRIILSMDEQRYLQISQRNPGLTNALNRINISEASHDETMRVMQDQLLLLEFQKNVTYMYQALKEAYRLSERYVHDLAMPGRALKLLESAASYHQDKLVTINSVQQAIEQTMDIKVSVASEADDREKLLHLEDHIHERMINQTRAVTVVSDALRRARAGVRNQNRPIGTFLFLGPTGVGKTELSKALAEVYFGGEGRMIRLDLNEFVQAKDVGRLIADGADDPTSLTAQVMKQPFSVILFDEIEKAHPQVLTTLLQLLDEGILRDIKNREVSFRDAIIVATSNAGADKIREYIETGYQLEQFEHQIIDQLISSHQFRPEFLNRFDEIVVFRPLSKDELVQVIDLILVGINKTLALQKVSVTVDHDAKLYLVDKGYDPRLGARPMRRIVQKAVENTIARQMLTGNVVAGGSIHITLEQVRTILDTQQAAAVRPVKTPRLVQ